MLSLALLVPFDRKSTQSQGDWGSWAEWFGAGVALLALIISVIAFVWSRGAGRQSVFLDLQESLNGDKATEGRRLLHLLKSESHARRTHKRRPAEWDSMNYAVNQLNTLAQYSKRNMVDPELAISIWGRSIRDSWNGLEIMIRYRRSLGRVDKWSSLIWLAEKAGVDVPRELKSLS